MTINKNTNMNINNTNTTMNNTVVDGVKKEAVIKKEKKMSAKIIDGLTGNTIIDSILTYGRNDMARTGRDWFIYDIPTSLIEIDDSYQRQVNDYIVRSILRNYDNNRVDVKLVNYRPDKDGGKFWILDGQHTLTVERELGHETLTCKVFIGLDKKEEARLFSKQNEFRRSISAYNQFKAEVVGQMYPACDIKRMCENYHIKIEQAKGFVPENTITSVRKLYNIVKRHGLEGLDFTLQTLIELGWNNVPAGMNEKVLCISEAFPYCRGNKKNYAKLMAVLGSFECPQNMVDFASDKFRNEAKTVIRCMEMFIKSIF